MTVRELIEKLQAFDSEAEAVLHDYEWGDNYSVTRVETPRYDYRAVKSTEQVEIS
jgi:hypothetical protein